MRWLQAGIRITCVDLQIAENTGSQIDEAARRLRLFYALIEHDSPIERGDGERGANCEVVAISPNFKIWCNLIQFPHVIGYVDPWTYSPGKPPAGNSLPTGKTFFLDNRHRLGSLCVSIFRVRKRSARSGFSV